MAETRGYRLSGRAAFLALAGYILLLYLSPDLSYDLYMFVFRRIGRDTASVWMNGAFAAVGLTAFLLLLRRGLKAGAWVAFLLISLAVGFCLVYLDIPAKRFHFFQYAPLTILVSVNVRLRCTDRYQYVWTLLAVSLVGLGDELIQGALPNRHFSFVDVFIDTGAGLLTLAFVEFVVGPDSRNEPAGRTPYGIQPRSPHLAGRGGHHGPGHRPQPERSE